MWRRCCKGPSNRESARTRDCRLGRQVARRFGGRGAWPLIGLGERAKIELFVEFNEERTVAAFERHAFGGRAAQKNAALWSFEGEKVCSAKEFTALLVLFFQQFGVLAKEAVGLFVGSKVNSSDKQQTFAGLVLINQVAIAIPRSGERRCAVLT